MQAVKNGATLKISQDEKVVKSKAAAKK